MKQITINIDKKTFVGVALVLFLVISAAGVFAPTVSHSAQQIVAGAFGNVYTGTWSFMNGSVGIGTANPSYSLDVVGAMRVGNDTQGYIDISGGAVTSPQLRFRDAGTIRARIGVPTGQTYLSLNAKDSLTPPHISILNSGKVGIGTTSPSHELNVIGDLNVTGDIYANSSSIYIGDKALSNDAGTLKWDDTAVVTGSALTSCSLTCTTSACGGSCAGGYTVTGVMNDNCDGWGAIMYRCCKVDCS